MFGQFPENTAIINFIRVDARLDIIVSPGHGIGVASCFPRFVVRVVSENGPVQEMINFCSPPFRQMSKLRS